MRGLKKIKEKGKGGKNTNSEIGVLIKKERQSELHVDAGERLHSELDSR